MESTLVIVPAPTLLDGLPQLARIGAAYLESQGQGEGVQVTWGQSDELLYVDSEPDLEAGTFSYATHTSPRIWDYFPGRDVVLTADGVHWL